MRATTSAQLTELALADRKELVRVYVDDSGGTPVNYGEGASPNWVDEVTVREDQDQFSAQATVTLFREVDDGAGGSTSLAPMVEATDAITAGRDVRIDVAVIAQGDSVAAGDWQTLFVGQIDRVRWGGGDSRLIIEARDEGGVLLDTWIESVTDYGDDSTPEDMEAVIQEIIDNNVAGVTITTPTSPSFGIVQFNQQRMSVAQATRQVTDLIAADFRYRHSSGSTFLPTLTIPDRTKTTPDFTLTAADYFAVSDMELGTHGIRNAVEVIYDEDGNSGTAVVTNSISEYRRRYMLIDASEDPQITTSTLAATLATNVASDLAQPLATQVVECAFYWPVELGDLPQFSANGIHYTSDQNMAVTGFEHRFSSSGPATTVMRVRGRPSGGTARWIEAERRSSVTKNLYDPSWNIAVSAPAPTGTPNAVVGASGTLSGEFAGAINTQSWKVLGGTSAPTSASVAAGTTVNSRYADTSLVGTLASLTATEVGWVAGIAYSGPNATGTPGNVVYDAERFGPTTDGISDGDIVASKLTNQAKGFSSSVVFTPTTQNQVSWQAGTIYFHGGTTASIDAGNTGALIGSGARYIYYDGTSTLAVTSDVADLDNDESYILLCSMVIASSGQTAQVWPAIGTLNTGGAPNINADNISANSISANTIQANAVTTAKIDALAVTAAKIAAGAVETDKLDANAVTAAKIAAGTITATEIAAGTITAAKMATGALSASNIEAGTIAASIVVASSSFTASLATFTGSIRVSGGGNQAELQNSSLAFDSAATFGKSGSDAVISSGTGSVTFSQNTTPTVTGSRDGNAALADLLSELDSMGLITDSSSA